MHEAALIFYLKYKRGFGDVDFAMSFGTIETIVRGWSLISSTADH